MADKIRIPVTVEGLPGAVSFDSWGHAVHGKFASHTGYHSFSSMGKRVSRRDGRDWTKEAQRIALELHRASSAWPFLVGEEHKEHGWKSIRLNYHGQIEVRLPNWHEGSVAEVLTQMDMHCDNELNQFWVFPEGTALKVAKAALRPILRPNARLVDEAILAAALDRSGRNAGLLCAMGQLSLF